jgi:hypothetical protein
VLLAFMVITVWQRYETASTNVDTEADELTTLWRLAAGFPDADRVRIQDMTKTYASVTISQDWPAMQQGKSAVVPPSSRTNSGASTPTSSLRTAKRATYLPSR